MDILLRVIAALAGTFVVVYTLITAIRTFVLPRAENAWLSRQVFRLTYNFFRLLASPAKTYEARDRALAFFGPVTLLLLPLVYLTMITAHSPNGKNRWRCWKCVRVRHPSVRL